MQTLAEISFFAFAELNEKIKREAIYQFFIIPFQKRYQINKMFSVDTYMLLYHIHLQNNTVGK